MNHLFHDIGRWFARLQDRDYREGLVEATITTIIPFQLRAMRERRGWTQKELARRAGMAQGRISVLENTNYEGAVNVRTLIKLAAAFDVALIVRFAPFSELITRTQSPTLADHDVPDFATEWNLLAQSDTDPTLTGKPIAFASSSTGAGVSIRSANDYAERNHRAVAC